jgi:dienelactone hydrolase
MKVAKERKMRKKSLTATLMVCLLTCLLSVTQAQEKAPEKKIKSGLTPEDWKYTLAEGVIAKEITYYSDGIGCYAKIFFPKGFSANDKTPGVVLGQGWAGTHFSIEKYGAKFAERGLVAMVIDYRGWGSSDSFIAQSQATVGKADPAKFGERDDKRFTNSKADVVLKRTRLIPMKQVEDYRNAISYLQGEPGVDPERIGIWGSSFAGGNVIVTAALDSRVKAIVGQIPAISGKNSPVGPVPLRGRALEDAIKRARTGQGAEFETGFSIRRMVDIETNQMVAEYRPFHYLQSVGNRPVLLIVAEKEELINNRDNAYAAIEVLAGAKKLIEVPKITHFEMYINEAFEISSNAAANWFREHLGLVPKSTTAGQKNN